MTIEPQHAVTVHIPSVRPEAERTLADYQADLIRRFGKLPSWPELARMECMARVRGTATPPSKPADKPAGRHYCTAQTNAADVEVLAALTEPMSGSALANKICRSESYVMRALYRLQAEGAVVRSGQSSATRWHRPDTAIEKVDERTAAIVAAMVRPMTLIDIMHKTGMAKTTTQTALNRAYEAGRVRKRFVKGCIIWEAA